MRLNWDLCSKCIDITDITNDYMFKSINIYFTNLEKLNLRLCLSAQNTSLQSLKYWINTALCNNNIYELTVEIVLVRELWNDNTLIAISAISQLIHKVLDNCCDEKYKKIKFKVSQLDCGNAAYLYLFNNILCEWIKNISSNLNAKLRGNKSKTFIIEIIIDHQLPEFIYIDPYHYRPMAKKGILQMFDNIANINQEINFRLILQKSSPWIASTSLLYSYKHNKFYDSLKNENIAARDYSHEGYEWIAFVFNSDLIKRNRKEQMIFNVIGSTILDASSIDYTVFARH